MEAQVIELRADDSRAKPALDRINESLNTIEQRAREMARKAKQAFEDFAAATVRAMRTAVGAVADFARQNQQLARDLAAIGIVLVQHHLNVERATRGYQLARLALSPYTYGLVLAAEAVAVLTLRQGRLIQAQAQAAAQARLTAREYQALANAAALTGAKSSTLVSATGAVRSNSQAFEDFGVQTSFGVYGRRDQLDIIGEAQARLSRIRNPFEREAQRKDLGLPAGLRNDFNESVAAGRLFGSTSSQEGIVAVDRIRNGVIGIKDGFLDAARAVKVFAGSMLRDAGEAIAILATRSIDLFRQFREQTANDPRGRTGLSGARQVQIPGARALLNIRDVLDSSELDRDPAKRRIRGPLAALYPGAPSESELKEQLRIGQQQIREIEEQQRRAREEAIRGEARSLEILAQARAKDGGEIAQIQQKYAQYRAELGKTTAAVNALREAERLEVAAAFKSARDRVFSDSRKAAADQVQQGVADVGAGARLRAFERGQSFQAELLGLQQQGDALALSPNGELEARRSSALSRLDTQELLARSVQQKVAIEQQKLAVEQQYIRETSQLRAEALRRDFDFEIEALKVQYETKLISEEQFQAKKEALTRIQQLNQDRLGGQTQQQLDAAREQSIQRQTSLYVQQANALQSSFERTIDALFSRTQSLGSAIFSILQAAFLTPLKQFSAAFLTNLVYGGRGQGGLGALGSIFTGGFAGGPGAGGIIGAGGGGGTGPGGVLSGVGGLAGFGKFSGLGAGAGLGLAAIGGSAFGLLGAARLGQSNSILGKSLAVPLGAFSGLLGFGGLTYLFPSLVAAGPAGWIAAAGIGAAVGLISLFRKPAEEKAVEKVKQVYGVNINRDLAKVIIEQAKALGGLDIAITAPQIREMIELYAMATGQRIGPGNSVRPVALVQSGGMLYQQSQMINQQPYVFQSPLPTLGGGASVIQVQLSSQGTQNFLEGQTVNVVANQRVATSQAVNAPLEWARTVYAG